MKFKIHKSCIGCAAYNKEFGCALGHNIKNLNVPSGACWKPESEEEVEVMARRKGYLNALWGIMP